MLHYGEREKLILGGGRESAALWKEGRDDPGWREGASLWKERIKDH